MIGCLITREELERGLYEAIRKEIVAAGYLPDAAVINEAAPDGGAAEWAAAKEALRATLPDGKLIEVMGPGSARSRDTVYANTIYINRAERRRGNISGLGKTEFEKYDIVSDTDFKYREIKYPDYTSHLIYNVRYYTDSTKYQRIISGIIDRALGLRRRLFSLKGDGTPGQGFWLHMENDTDLSTNEYFEALLKYRAEDVWLTAPTVAENNISPAKEITVGITPTNNLPTDVNNLPG